VVSRGDDDGETADDSAGPRQQVVEAGDSDDSGDGDRGDGLVSRLRERASQAVGAAAADTDDDDGVSPGEETGIKAEAVEQVNDQLEDASVNAGDVEVVEEDGEVTVRLPPESRKEIAAEQVAADTDLEPGKDFEVTVADGAVQDLAAGNAPDLEVELTARGRSRRAVEQVKEQGGIKTENGEVIEAEPEDLVFDEEGRVVDIDRGGDGGGGGVVDTLTSGFAELGDRVPGTDIAVDIGEGAVDTAGDVEQGIRNSPVGSSAPVGIAAGTLGPAADTAGDVIGQRGETIAGLSDAAVDATVENVVEPASETAALVGTFNPAAVGNDSVGGTPVARGEAAERGVEGVGAGVANLTLGLPRDAVRLAADAEQAGQFTADAVAEEGVVEGTGTVLETGGEIAVGAAEATEQQVRENPARSLGLAAGGLAGGGLTSAGVTAARRGASAARTTDISAPEFRPSPRQQDQINALREADVEARGDGRTLGSADESALDAIFDDPARFRGVDRPDPTGVGDGPTPGLDPVGRRADRPDADEVGDLPLGEQVGGGRFPGLGDARRPGPDESIGFDAVADQLPDSLRRLAEDESGQASLVGASQRRRRSPDSDPDESPEPQPETFESFAREERRRSQRRSRQVGSSLDAPAALGARTRGTPFDEIDSRRDRRQSERTEPVDERPGRPGLQSLAPDPRTAGGALGLGAEGLVEEETGRVEVAQTPATETSTTAGLGLDDELTPTTDTNAGTDTDTALDVVPATDAAADAALTAESVATGQLTDQVQTQTPARRDPDQTPPRRNGRPRDRDRPRRAPPFRPGTPRRGRVPDLDDDDDDDEEPLPGLGFGEASTQFANPVVGGPEAFGVAGGAAVGGDRDSDESQQPGLGIGVI